MNRMLFVLPILAVGVVAQDRPMPSAAKHTAFDGVHLVAPLADTKPERVFTPAVGLKPVAFELCPTSGSPTVVLSPLGWTLRFDKPADSAPENPKPLQ